MKSAQNITWILILIGLLTTGFIPMQAHAVTEKSTTPPYANISAQDESQGPVRVIVGLHLGDTSDPSYGDGLIDEQARIAAVQQKVLDKLTTGTQLASTSLVVHHQYTTLPALALTVDNTMLEMLANTPEVAYISEDTLSAPMLDQSAVAIGADEAWQGGYTGEGWTVAVLDSGVDSNHRFLQNTVVAEACFSTHMEGYAISLCPSGEETEIGTGSAESCDPSIAACMHGTHVAGIVAGENDTMAGIAKDASIIAVQIFSRFDNAEYCGGASPCILSFASDQIAALEHVYKLRKTYDIAAINLSLGRGQYSSAATCDKENPAYTEAVQQLVDANIAVVASSGNAGYTNGISYPACMSDVVSVGATGGQNQVASFSNSSTLLDLLAPGVAIQSSIPGNTYASLQGTSMAAPHVAGAWAVVRSQVPDASIARVLSAMKQTGISITDSRNGIKTSFVQLNKTLRSFDGIELEMIMDVTPKQVHPGDLITYTLTVTNTGVERVSQVVLTSTIPLNTELFSISNDGRLQDGAIRWDSITIGAGQSIKRTYQTKVNPVYPVSASVFYDDMEQGADNWDVSHDNAYTANDWTQHTGLPHSGTTAWYAKNVGETSRQFLVMELDDRLPAYAELHFWHWFSTEHFFDGGIVEISTDNGKTWQDLGDKMTQNGYNSKIDDYYGNPLGNVAAFTGKSDDYQETIVELHSYAGKTIHIRFQLATDSSGKANGWYIDDVSIATTSPMQSNARVQAKTFVEFAAAHLQVEPIAVEPPPPASDDPRQVFVDDGRGGIIQVTDERGLETTIEIPDHAVDALTKIVYTEIGEEPSHTLSADFIFAGRAFMVQAYRGDEHLEDFTFQQPVTITMEYDASGMTEGEEQALRIYTRYHGVWQDVAEKDYQADTVEHTVQVQAHRTGEFMLMYVEEKQQVEQQFIMLFPLIMK